MSKSKTLTVALIVVLIVLGVAAWFLFGSTASGLSYPNAEKYSVGDASVSGTVNNLFIDWTAGKVNVEYYGGTEITVSETANRSLSEDDKLRWWLDGDTLRVRYAKPGFRISFDLDKQLTVRLPFGTELKSADIGSTSGDLYIPALTADSVRLDSTSGRIDASTLTKQLTVSSTSGDVTLYQNGALDSADLSSTSGSVSFFLEGSMKKIEMKSTSGGVSLTVTGSADEIKLHSTSGNIYTSLPSVKKAEISSTSGSYTGTVKSFDDLKINTTSGSVNATLGADPGFTCKVSTSSGYFNSELPLVNNGNTYTCGDGSAKCEIGTSSGGIWIGKAD